MNTYETHKCTCFLLVVCWITESSTAGLHVWTLNWALVKLTDIVQKLKRATVQK